MGRHTTTRRRHLHNAMAHLEELREQAAFERLTVETSDGGRHWRFLKDKRFILSYYPAVCKAHVAGQRTAEPCYSPTAALRLAKTVLRAQPAGDPPPEPEEPSPGGPPLARFLTSPPESP